MYILTLSEFARHKFTNLWLETFSWTLPDTLSLKAAPNVRQRHFHLFGNSGNFGSFYWKIPRESGKSKRYAHFPGWKVSNGILRSNYTFLVVYTSFRSTPRKSVMASSQNKMTSLEPSLMYECASAQFLFLLPPPNDQRHGGKTVKRSSSYRKHSARNENRPQCPKLSRITWPETHRVRAQ